MSGCRPDAFAAWRREHVTGAPGEIRTALVLSEMPPTNWVTGAWCSLEAVDRPLARRGKLSHLRHRRVSRFGPWKRSKPPRRRVQPRARRGARSGSPGGEGSRSRRRSETGEKCASAAQARSRPVAGASSPPNLQAWCSCARASSGNRAGQSVLSLPRHDPPRQAPASPGSPEAARRLFAMARPIHGTLAETYLRRCAITYLGNLPALRCPTASPTSRAGSRATPRRCAGIISPTAAGADATGWWAISIIFGSCAPPSLC